MRYFYHLAIQIHKIEVTLEYVIVDLVFNEILITCLMSLFFMCITGKSKAPIPFKRNKSNLKKLNLIHKNEKSVKVMKHPFLVVDSDSDGDIGEEIGQAETRSLKRPQSFMLRNLPTSLRARLDPMNGKFS